MDTDAVLIAVLYPHNGDEPIVATKDAVISTPGIVRVYIKTDVIAPLAHGDTMTIDGAFKITIGD